MIVRTFSVLLPSACLAALSLSATSCTSPVVSETALNAAKQRVAAEIGEEPKEGSLVVVDYSKPSSQRRLSVVDLKTGRARMNSLVAHGVNSGLLYATNFSDRVGSNQSSLGLYRIAEPYVGKHGPSLRLDGLDPGFNINARRRAIVIHSADYVSKDAMRENRAEGGRLGRSAGCLSLSDRDMKRFSRKVDRPAYVFAYAPTMMADLGYTLPVDPDVPAAVPPAAAAPQPMLASAETPAAPRETPASRPMPELAAAPRPQLLGTDPAMAPPRNAAASASHREREWTPLLTVSDTLR